MKKIHIIGGGGYVGCAVIDFFLKKNFSVICSDNFIYGHNFSIKKFTNNKNFKFNKLDLNNKNLNFSKFNVNFVVVLAGLVGDPITKKYKKKSILINEFGIKKIVNYYKDKKVRFIFVSTCSNYGVSKNITNEKSKLRPKSLYAKQKVIIEKYIFSLKKKATFSPVILRFATAFGISLRPRFDLTLNQFVLNAFLKKNLEIYDHETWRPYCHIKDFAKVIFKCLFIEKNKVNFEVYNVGSDINNSRKIDLAKAIEKFFPQFNYKISNKSKDMRDYRVSFKKVKNKLKIKNFYPIKFGILEIKNYLNKSKQPEKYLKYGNYKLLR